MSDVAFPTAPPIGGLSCIVLISVAAADNTVSSRGSRVKRLSSASEISQTDDTSTAVRICG